MYVVSQDFNCHGNNFSKVVNNKKGTCNTFNLHYQYLLFLNIPITKMQGFFCNITRASVVTRKRKRMDYGL
jgi:hypothetical protein